MVDYNGFPGWYRTQQGAGIYRAVRDGTVVLAACDVCGVAAGDRALMAHLEDYDHPDTFVPICRACHMTLHKRFNQPGPWVRLLDSIDDGICPRQAAGHRAPGWARALALVPIDLRTGRPALTAPTGASPGSGKSWSGSARNGFAERARAKKVDALVDWLAEEGIDPRGVVNASMGEWRMWARAAGVNAPSPTTVDAVIKVLTTATDDATIRT